MLHAEYIYRRSAFRQGLANGSGHSLGRPGLGRKCYEDLVGQNDISLS